MKQEPGERFSDEHAASVIRYLDPDQDIKEGTDEDISCAIEYLDPEPPVPVLIRRWWRKSRSEKT